MPWYSARLSQLFQRRHQGTYDYIMCFDRVESDNLRVTLAVVIERFHTRHSNLRTTYSDTTDTPTTVLTPQIGYYCSTNYHLTKSREGIRTYIAQEVSL